MPFGIDAIFPYSYESRESFYGALRHAFQHAAFRQISNSDYLPAFEEGIRQHNQEIEAIINNRAVADFDNTIAALDNAGQLLENVTYVFNGLYDACSTPELQTLGEQILPMLSKHNDEVMMNERLFSRVKQVYDNRKKFNLTNLRNVCLRNTTSRWCAAARCCRLRRRLS